MRFVVGFGIVSMLADFVYEGGRSVVGPYLATFGASAAAVGLISGAGEAVALVFRLFTGPLADRTRRHWALSLAGYAITAVCVPLLAVAGALWSAAALVLGERFGKAVRSPAKSTLLSHAGAVLGQGRAFAVNEALDQTGALLGPLLVAGMIALSGYRLGFAVLAVPAVLLLVALARLRLAVPVPADYETAAGAAGEPAAGGPAAGGPGADGPGTDGPGTDGPADDGAGGGESSEPGDGGWGTSAGGERADGASGDGERAGRDAAAHTPRAGSWFARFPPTFWLYTAFTALTMGGYATFAVLAFHWQVRHVIHTAWIPVVYAAAMGVDALAALASGRLYDRVGLRVLLALPPLAAVVPFLAFTASPASIWAGALIWGAAMGVHESTMKAAVADLVPADRRGAAYGVFATCYGIAWLAGSAVIGALSGTSHGALITFTLVLQACALAAFVPLARRRTAVPRRS